MSRVRRVWSVVVALAVGSTAGCGGSGAKLPTLTGAEGVVLLGGQPLPHALVTFTPTAPGLPGNAAGSAVTDASGRFVLSTAGQPGVVPGEHAVTVVDGPTPDDLRGDDAQDKMAKFQAGLKNRPIPAKYGTLAKSGVKMTVTTEQKEYKVELIR